MTRLNQRRQSSLFRRRLPRQSTTVNGMFAGNDYLSLSQHPEVIAAAQQALNDWGAGSSGSPLLSGYCLQHQALEQELAEWLGVQRTLLFNSGFAANHGVLTTLPESGTIHFDRLSHASLIDGIRHSKKRFKRFHHNALHELNANPGDWLVTEGTFSMDGDRAPAAALATTVAEQKLNLILDDAHGLGVWNSAGLGSFASLNKQTRLLTGTFGKAFGVAGAFVAGNDDDIETLVQFCREYIYSTAFPPSQAAAIRASLAIIRSDEGERRRQQLAQHIDRFKSYMRQAGLATIDSDSPIQTWVIGDDEAVMTAAQLLREQGIWVSAVRPPTVPAGTSRIRISLQSGHTQQHLKALTQALDKVAQQLPSHVLNHAPNQTPSQGVAE